MLQLRGCTSSQAGSVENALGIAINVYNMFFEKYESVWVEKLNWLICCILSKLLFVFETCFIDDCYDLLSLPGVIRDFHGGLRFQVMRSSGMPWMSFWSQRFSCTGSAKKIQKVFCEVSFGWFRPKWQGATSLLVRGTP